MLCKWCIWYQNTARQAPPIPHSKGTGSAIHLQRKGSCQARILPPVPSAQATDSTPLPSKLLSWLPRHYCYMLLAQDSLLGKAISPQWLINWKTINLSQHSVSELPRQLCWAATTIKKRGLSFCLVSALRSSIAIPGAGRMCMDCLHLRSCDALTDCFISTETEVIAWKINTVQRQEFLLEDTQNASLVSVHQQFRNSSNTAAGWSLKGTIFDHTTGPDFFWWDSTALTAKHPNPAINTELHVRLQSLAEKKAWVNHVDIRNQYWHRFQIFTFLMIVVFCFVFLLLIRS